MSRILKASLLSFLLLLSLPSCIRRDFKLEFSLPEDVSATYTVNYYASGRNTGFLVEKVAVVTAGKGTLSCPTARPAVVFISDPSGIDLPVYAGRGDNIRISGPDRNPWSWKIEGNDIDEELSEWISVNEPALIGRNREAINDSIASYVCRKPDSPVSSLLLLTLFSRRTDETAFRRLWNKTAVYPEAKRMASLIGRADIPDAKSPTPGKLVSAVFRSLDNGVDTLKPTESKASILYFWSNGEDADRNTGIDSLKTLAAEFPDSASRIIADFGLVADSLSWKAPLAKDSIDHTVRLWVPAGLADSRIMALRVERTPFFIVVDPSGNQAYRGENPGDALSTFRELIK